MSHLFAYPVALLAGLGRRVSGGGLEQWTGVDPGDYPTRMLYGASLAASAAAAGADPVTWLPFMLAGFLGRSIPLFSGMAMGRDGGPYWRAAAGMLAHGLVHCAVVAVVAVWFYVLPSGGAEVARLWPFLAAGALCPVAYEIGWRTSRPWFPLGFRGGNEIAELIFGTLVGLAVIGVI